MCDHKSFTRSYDHGVATDVCHDCGADITLQVKELEEQREAERKAYYGRASR